ncbi:MAG: hypothetical protein WB611_29320, partial [Stellaceae bacterium]
SARATLPASRACAASMARRDKGLPEHGLPDHSSPPEYCSAAIPVVGDNGTYAFRAQSAHQKLLARLLRDAAEALKDRQRRQNSAG